MVEEVFSAVEDVSFEDVSFEELSFEELSLEEEDAGLSETSHSLIVEDVAAGSVEEAALEDVSFDEVLTDCAEEAAFDSSVEEGVPFSEEAVLLSSAEVSLTVIDEVSCVEDASGVFFPLHAANAARSPIHKSTTAVFFILLFLISQKFIL